MSGTTAVVSSLFSIADVVSLRSDRLAGLQAAYFPQVQLSDSYLLEQLQAAEAELQHELRCFFTPRSVVPVLASPGMIAAAQAANPTYPIIYEPGYDYTPQLFQGESWGLIKLRQLPCIGVDAITFNYPLPSDVAYTIPAPWIRADLKYGIVNLLPVQSTTNLPLNAFLLSVLGGGFMTPFLMQISYRCGMLNAKQDYPDLVNIIKRLAMCLVIEDQFLPQSGSISVDGLSQSLSVECSKYRDSVEARASKLRDQIHGVRMVVC